MALTRDEAIARAVARAYENAELKVLQRLVYAMRAGGDGPDWERTTLARLQRLRQLAVDEITNDPDFEQDMRRNVYQAYRSGHAAMLADIADTVPAVHSTTLQQSAAVKRIASELVDGLKDASVGVLRRVDDVFREIVGGAALDAAARGVSRREAALQALDKMAERGLTFRDRGGRLWRLPEYAEMATRTSLANAQIAGHEAALDQIGLQLVIVQPGPRSCRICDEWARKVLNRDPAGKTGTVYVMNELTGKNTSVRVDGTLAAARDAGFQHPNCRCRLRAFIPGVTKRSALDRPAWDAEGYEAQQQQRAIERRIRAAKLKASTDGTPANKLRVKRLHGELDAHLERNPDLKRQTDRTSIGGRFATPGERTTRKRAQADAVPFVRDPFEDVVRPVKPTLRPVVPPITPKVPTAPKVTKPRAPKPVAPKPDAPFTPASLDGVKRLPLGGDSYSVSSFSGKANRGEGTGAGDFNNNCHFVVSAMELRARGYDVTARGTGAGLGRYDQSIVADWRTPDGKTRPAVPLSDFEGTQSRIRMRNFVEDMPVGARGFIMGSWKRGGGHIYNWEKTADGVKFYEGQVLRVTSEDAEKYLTQMKPDTINVIRVDDLVPTDRLMQYVVAERREIETMLSNAGHVSVLEQRIERIENYKALNERMIADHQAEIAELSARQPDIKGMSPAEIVAALNSPTALSHDEAMRLARLRAEVAAMERSGKTVDQKRKEIERSLARMRSGG